MSIFPLLADTASKCSKGKVLTLGLLVCIVFLLASVWVVAYNFVPGGTFARERNDTIMIIAMLLMGKASPFLYFLLHYIGYFLLSVFLIKLLFSLFYFPSGSLGT